MPTDEKNQTIRAMIADDEPLARELLRAMLEEERDIEIIAECGDGRDAAEQVSELGPDLLFLDIQMPELDGFEVLESLPEARLPVVVFVSAFDRYAIRAFEVHALDYVLKPFDEGRLRLALERARGEVARRRRDGGQMAAQMLAMLKELRVRPSFLERLVIKEEGRLFFRAVDEVDWFEADGKYIRVHTGKEVNSIREGISRLEAELDPDRFVRISRSAIVNIDRIKELRPWFQGDYLVVLKDGKQLASTRGFREGIHTLLGRKG